MKAVESSRTARLQFSTYSLLILRPSAASRQAGTASGTPYRDDQHLCASAHPVHITAARLGPGEIAAKMGIPVSKVRKVLKIAQEPISLETPIGEEEDSHLKDFIEDRGAVSPVETVMHNNLREQTSVVLKTLTPREEKVLKMRFGVAENENTRKSGQSFHGTASGSRASRSRGQLRHPSRSRLLGFHGEPEDRDRSSEAGHPALVLP